MDSSTGNTFILDYAYEDVAGASILAGDMGSPAIPEPGSLALAGLAAAGVMAARRRRR